MKTGTSLMSAREGRGRGLSVPQISSMGAQLLVHQSGHMESRDYRAPILSSLLKRNGPKLLSMHIFMVQTSDG